MDTRFFIVEKGQGLDAVPGLQFNFLRGGDGNVLVIALEFLYPESAGLTVGEQDFAQLVRLIVPQQFPVPPDAEPHMGQHLHGLPVILGDPQAGQGLIF